MTVGKLKLQSVTCATGIERVVHADDVHVHNKYSTELLSTNSVAIGTLIRTGRLLVSAKQWQNKPVYL